MALDERRLDELQLVVDEQAALRRIATLVAAGTTEADVAAAVSSEIGGLFDAQAASVVRWEGDTIRVIGRWRADPELSPSPGDVLSYGGDTLAARVVETAAPARVDSAADLRTKFARQRWTELGFEASIGAPIMVDGTVWGVVSAFRSQPGDTFAEGDEHRLGDFSALVAQAIVNAGAREETTALVAEQSSLRQIATLVAAGRPSAVVFDAVTAEAATLFGAANVLLLQWEGVRDEVRVTAAHGAAPALYHPDPDGPTLRVLETGAASHGAESSTELGPHDVIAAPVIANGLLFGVLTAARPRDEPFPAGAEIRLRSFADLAAQAIANERAQAELRASRARIVQTADDARRRLERNLHDGAQQRLLSVSLALRLVEQMLRSESSTAHDVLHEASSELGEAMRELRELARGLHPALLSTHGLGPALETVCARAPFPVDISGVPTDRPLPGPVEAAIYYVISESLANAAKHAVAASATVTLSCTADEVTAEIADDGIGGATFDAGSGLRGLVDRVEALGGELVVSSPQGSGTLVRATLPLSGPGEGAPSFPPKPAAQLATMSGELSWEPVFVLLSADGAAHEEMLSLLGDEYGATAEREGDWWRLTIRPIDQFRRGTIIYRIVQASRTFADRHPHTDVYLVTEDGNRWTLPPPALTED